MLFFPLPGTYAVVEIDVERTLQILDDPVANAAGAKIKTTKAIVYLDMILQLPFPDDETFKYMAYLIGPGLRPEHPELYITPDMCIPIYPNTQHPVEDREALKSEPPFPFDHCYHWFGPDMWLDLRIVNDGRDYSVGTHTILPPDQHVKMVGVQGRDIWRSICSQKERDDLTGTNAVPLVASESTQESQPPRMRSPSPARSISTSGTEPLKQDPVPSVSAAGSDCGGECEEHEQCGCYGGVSGECYSVSVSEDDGEDAPRFSVHPSSGGSCRSTQSLNELDIFGLDGDDQDDLLPIVKISLDLGAHLEGEDVPDPMAFMRQRDELVKIIEESKARAREQARDAADSLEASATESDLVVRITATASPEPYEATPHVEEDFGSSTVSVSTAEGKQGAKGFWSTLASAFASILRGIR